MADHDGWCPCPMLRAQAEIERLVALGVAFGSLDIGRTLIIARLREKYGCRGPDWGSCRWDRAIGYGNRLEESAGRLRIVGNSGEGAGQYL